MRVVYFAAPLFTQAERLWNARVADGLRAAGFTVILPQERAMDVIKPGEPLPVRRLYELALDGIRQADWVLAVLDGSDPDSGTSFECGYAGALGKRLLGVRTDLRTGGDDVGYDVNLMLSQACIEFVRVDPEDLDGGVDGLVRSIDQRLRQSVAALSADNTTA